MGRYHFRKCIFSPHDIAYYILPLFLKKKSRKYWNLHCNIINDSMGKGGLHGIKVLFSNKDTQHCVNSLSFQPDPAINNFQKDDEGFGKFFPYL